MTNTKLRKHIGLYMVAAILTVGVFVVGLRSYVSSYVPVARIVYPKAMGYYDIPMALDISPDDKYIACVDLQRSLKVWSIPDVHLTATCQLPQRVETHSVTWLANNRDIAVHDGYWMHNFAGALRNNLHLVGQIQVGAWAPLKSPSAYKISPSGTLVGEGWDDGTLRVWNESTGRNTVFSQPLPNETGEIFSKSLANEIGRDNYKLEGFAFSPDSSTVAAAYFLTVENTAHVLVPGGKSFQLRLYDALTGKLRRSWEWNDPRTPIGCPDSVPLAVSQDGKCVASAERQGSPSDNARVVLWNADNGRRLRTIHISGACLQVAFIGRGPLLAAADGSDRILIWNYNTGRLEHCFHDAGMTQRFVVSRDGRYLASSSIDSHDKTSFINLWDLKEVR